MGDDTQLGHASSLQSGQRVPDGKRYHGSPAVETTSDYCPIEGKEVGWFRTAFYSSLGLAALFLVAVPLPILGYHLWDQYAPATDAGLSRRRLDAVAARDFGGVVLRRDDLCGSPRSTSSRACACCS